MSKALLGLCWLFCECKSRESNLTLKLAGSKPRNPQSQITFSYVVCSLWVLAQLEWFSKALLEVGVLCFGCKI